MANEEKPKTQKKPLETKKSSAKEKDKPVESKPEEEKEEKNLEEKKEEKKTENSEAKKEPKKEVKEAVKEEKLPEKKAEPAPVTVPKRKKINKMSLEEIEAKIEEVKNKMGGLHSKYARQLLIRRDYLRSLK